MFNSIFNRPKKAKPRKRASWDAPGHWLLEGSVDGLTRLEIQRSLSSPRWP